MQTQMQTQTQRHLGLVLHYRKTGTMTSKLRLTTLAALTAFTALTAALIVTGAANAQTASKNAAASAPAAAASGPVAPTIRPDFGKPLIEAQALLAEKKIGPAKAKIALAEAMADKTPYENFILARLKLSAAIDEDDAAGATQLMERLLVLNEGTGSAPGSTSWIKPDELPRLLQAVAISHYRTKSYEQAAAWTERSIKAGSVDQKSQDIRLQSYFLANNFAKTTELAEEEIAAAQKAGRPPAFNALELLAQSRDKLKDVPGGTRAIELLVQYYPKKDYWQSLVNRIWSKADLATRLQLDVFRLASQLGTLSERNDYSEYVDYAQKAGYSGEALRAFDAGVAAGFLGAGADAAKDQKLRTKLVTESEQDKKTQAADIANALKKPDGTGMVTVGLGLVGAQQFDKGLELMEKGIAKGVPKRPEEARLHLAIAYAWAGQTDKAIQTFATVSGKEGLDELARYWAMAIRKP